MPKAMSLSTLVQIARIGVMVLAFITTSSSMFIGNKYSSNQGPALPVIQDEAPKYVLSPPLVRAPVDPLDTNLVLLVLTCLGYFVASTNNV